MNGPAEHRHPTQHPISLVLQLIAPVEGGPQRTVPVVESPPGQRSQPVQQPRFETVKPSDGNRAAASPMASPHAIQASADGDDTRCVDAGRQVSCCGRPGQEQTDSVPGRPVLGAHRQPRHQEHPCVGKEQPRPAGCHTTSRGQPARSALSRTSTPSSRCSQFQHQQGLRSANQPRTVSETEPVRRSPRPGALAMAGVNPIPIDRRTTGFLRGWMLVWA